jgi:pimeloyl-ACP methyl ester carboxylesterase
MGGEESFETIDGCRIKLMRGGAGEPLLFLHGAGGARVWAPFMETLSQSFDLIVPEHPGYGASDMPQWLDNVGDLAYFYLDLIDKLGLDRVNLVGTSIGGWIAAEIAVRNDTKLKSLVLSAEGRHLPVVAGAIRTQPVPRPKNGGGLARPSGRRRRAARRDEEQSRDRAARLAAAALRSRPAQMAASHFGADADSVG